MVVVSIVCGLVVAAVRMGGVQAQTIETFDPPRFNGNRTLTDLLFMYTFDQDECAAGAFADKRNDTTSLLGDLTYDQGAWGTVTKCPLVNNSGTIFENAYHGAKSQGQRVPAPPTSPPTSLLREDWVESSNDVSSLKTALMIDTDFAIEMWIRPDASFTLTQSANEYVLLELGSNTFSAGGGFTWGCGSDFDLQIRYVDGTSNAQLVIEFVTAFGCDDLTSNIVLNAGQLYHVVFNLQRVGTMPSFNTQVRLVVDNVQIRQSDRDEIDLGAFDSQYSVRVGSSPAALSTNAATLLVHSWPGDVLFFAMYSDDLTQGTTSEVADNFAAGLPNSVPVASTTTVSFTGTEDQFVDVNISEAFYDADFDRAGLPLALTEFLTSNLTADPLNGQLRLDGTTLVTGSTPLPAKITSVLAYRPAANLYGTGGTFTVSAEDEFNAPLFGPPATFEIIVDPANDDPTALPFDGGQTAQLVSRKLEFRGADIDCVSTDAPGSPSCVDFGLNKTIVIPDPSTDIGLLYLPTGSNCPGYSDPGSIPINPSQPYIETIEDPGDAVVELCFEACFGVNSTNACPSEKNDLAILGDAEFDFFVVDETGANSITATVTTEVISVLTTDVDVEVTVNEDEPSIIQLKSIDFFCEDAVDTPKSSPPMDCATRFKNYTLSALPPATQGTMYFDAAMTIPAMTGVSFNGTLFFMPAEDYFSAESWPICNVNAGGSSGTFSQCPKASTVAVSVFPCEGPLCGDGTIPGSLYEKFTTTDIGLGVFGDDASDDGSCASDTEKGCPLNLNYTVSVNSATSTSAIGVRVYTINVPDLGTIVLPDNSSFVDLDSGVEFTLVDEMDQFIEIVDVDNNARVVDLIVSVAGSSQLVLDMVIPESKQNVVVIRPEGARFSGTKTITCIGTVDEVNEAMRNLKYRTTSAILSDVVSIRYFDPSRGGDLDSSFTQTNGVDYTEATASIPLTFEEEKDGSGPRFSLPVIAVYGLIGAGGICCIGFCCGIILTIGHCAARGSKTARWVLKNVLCSRLTPAQSEAELRKRMSGAAHMIEAEAHAEHTRLEEIEWCAHCLAVVCPSCVKFSAKEDLVPDEERVVVRANDRLKDKVAANHIPQENRAQSVRLLVSPEEIFDWEEHSWTDPDTGRTIPYFYNTKTQQSVWIRPKVREETPAPDAI